MHQALALNSVPFNHPLLWILHQLLILEWLPCHPVTNSILTNLHSWTHTIPFANHAPTIIPIGRQMTDDWMTGLSLFMLHIWIPKVFFFFSTCGLITLYDWFKTPLFNAWVSVFDNLPSIQAFPCGLFDSIKFSPFDFQYLCLGVSTGGHYLCSLTFFGVLFQWF